MRFASIFVLEADGAGLKVGQKARFVIEGRPGEEYEASVSRVEPLAKTRDWQSPVKYFETTLQLARAEAGDLKPGQKVRAILRLDEADAVLTIPRGGRLREGRQARRLPQERLGLRAGRGGGVAPEHLAPTALRLGDGEDERGRFVGADAEAPSAREDELDGVEPRHVPIARARAARRATGCYEFHQCARLASASPPPRS